MGEGHCKHLQEHVPHRSNRLEESQGEQELHYFPVLQQLIWEQRLKNGQNLSPTKDIFVLNGNKRIQAKSWDKLQCGIRIYGGRKKDGKEVP